MPIENLRNETNELRDWIISWEADIEELQDKINNARLRIQANEAEIERLEAEAVRNDLITQLTEALTRMSNEELAGLVSSLQNGETPSPADHPTVTVPESPRFTTVDTRAGEIAIEVPEDRPSSWCISLDECIDGIDLIVEEMATADMTLVGVRHQDLLTVNHYVPKIGELVRLEKETATSNCYGVLIASETNGLEEDMAIGILPTDGGSKKEELLDNGFPCVCHQDMWNDPRLDELYEITGVLVGRYVTIRKVESVTPVTEEEVETVEEESSIDSTLLDLRTLVGTASTIAEARNVFSNEMSNQCTIRRDLNTPIQEITNGFIVYYDDHRHNEMENVHQAILISKPE